MSDTTTQARVEGGNSNVLPARRLFTADEFQRMGEVGILDEDERVELLNGEILLMGAIGSLHFGCVNTLNERFAVGLAGRAIVSVQNPVRLSSGAEPQPDLVLLHPRKDRYYHALPGPEDVLLLVEVSDTTLRYDAETKLPLYARAGIPEVWIVDLEGGRVLTHRDPSGAAYGQIGIATRAGAVSPAAFPEFAIQIEDLLG